MSGPPRAGLRWVVGANDGSDVGDVLALAGADPAAVAEGRVFVGRRRVRRPDEAVGEGDVVEIAAPRAALEGVSVLAHEGDVVAVDKPAGIPTIADHGGAAHALLTLVARALAVDPGSVHPTSRLDRDVSGVVLFALSPGAAARLDAARKAGTYERRYVAIAARAPAPEAGLWSAPIGRAPRSPRQRAVGGRDAVSATTRYAVCGRAPGGAALLVVSPLTGRTHQIRVHAAHAGAPLVGDRTYGGPVRVASATGRVHEPGRIALHALRVAVPGPGAEPLVAVAPVPAGMAELWSSLGGAGDAWELASSWVFAPS